MALRSRWLACRPCRSQEMSRPPTAATLPHPIDAHHEKRRRYGGAFLAGFRNANTRTSYRQQLQRWFAWCDA